MIFFVFVVALAALGIASNWQRGFSPVVTALGSKAPALTPEKKFLRLAVSLAEKEIKLTHTESAAEGDAKENELHQ